jgi:NTP pyrophosphatase (non-canonical NTP hydrolase)
LKSFKKRKPKKMTLNELRDMAYLNAAAHGFWDGVDKPDPGRIAQSLALIHSEVSEALEDARKGKMVTLRLASQEGDKGKPVGFPSELADIIIRVADLAGKLGIDLEKEVAFKMQYNARRPHKHGKAF